MRLPSQKRTAAADDCSPLYLRSTQEEGHALPAARWMAIARPRPQHTEMPGSRTGALLPAAGCPVAASGYAPPRWPSAQSVQAVCHNTTQPPPAVTPQRKVGRMLPRCTVFYSVSKSTTYNSCDGLDAPKGDESCINGPNRMALPKLKGILKRVKSTSAQVNIVSGLAR